MPCEDYPGTQEEHMQLCGNALENKCNNVNSCYKCVHKDFCEWVDDKQRSKLFDPPKKGQVLCTTRHDIDSYFAEVVTQKKGGQNHTMKIVWGLEHFSKYKENVCQNFEV